MFGNVGCQRTQLTLIFLSHLKNLYQSHLNTKPLLLQKPSVVPTQSLGEKSHSV